MTTNNIDLGGIKYLPIDTVDLRDLYDIMSEISEECYSAGWIMGNEYSLWNAHVTGELNFGMSNIDADELQKVIALSEKTGHWIVWLDDDVIPDFPARDVGPYAVSLSDWKLLVDERNRQELIYKAQHLVSAALAQGFVLSIFQKPLTPLAMGNTETVCEVRRKLVRG